MDILKIINYLGTIAEDMVPVSNARMAAAVYYKNKLISVGTNQYKTHPFALEYAKNPEARFLHAEADVILKARKRLSERELSKSSLFVVRIKNNQKGDVLFGLAKPCSGCLSCIQDHRIKRVIYTTNSNVNCMSYVTEERMSHT